MNSPDRYYGENYIDRPQNQTNTETQQFIKRENAEIIPYLRVTVTHRHFSPAEHCVGLTKKQRQALKLNIGDSVEVFSDSQEFLGRYRVGLGLKEHKQYPHLCTANNIAPNTTILIIKKREKKHY